MLITSAVDSRNSFCGGRADLLTENVIRLINSIDNDKEHKVHAKIMFMMITVVTDGENDVGVGGDDNCGWNSDGANCSSQVISKLRRKVLVAKERSKRDRNPARKVTLGIV